MSASLVGSEMCIRDSCATYATDVTQDTSATLAAAVARKHPGVQATLAGEGAKAAWSHQPGWPTQPAVPGKLR
eukprot:1296962-Alexandrium_andersonii.AAC.1